ncbi:MAG: hypothetical protein ABR498_01970, partial [Candidatus Dormibacteria bacterium]
VMLSGHATGTFNVDNVGSADQCSQAFGTRKGRESHVPVGDFLNPGPYADMHFTSSKWHGPGTYHVGADATSSDFDSSAKFSANHVDYRPASGTVTLNADGTGSFTFTAFKDAAGDMINASGSWKCEDRLAS